MNRDNRPTDPRFTSRVTHPPRRGGGRRALTLAMLAILCALVCVSCSDEPSVDVSPRCLEFLPSDGTAAGHVTTRMGADSVCNDADVEIVATAIEGIYSTEITLAYPIALAFPISVQVGPLLLPLDDDGEPQSIICEDALSVAGVNCFITNNVETGTLDLSISRTPQTDESVDAPPEGAVLATVTFLQLTTLAGSNGPLDFNYGKLLDDGSGSANGSPAIIIDVAEDPSAFVGGQMMINEL